MCTQSASSCRLTGQRSIRFAGRLYQIYELDNNAKLWVPGRDPLNLTPQGTAMPYGENSKASSWQLPSSSPRRRALH